MFDFRRFPTLLLATSLVACAGDDAFSNGAAKDASLADVTSDTSSEAAPPTDATAPDAADAAYVPTPCDPQNDTCGGAKKCCALKASSSDAGPDGGYVYGCVFVKPPADTCPPVK